MFEFNATFLIAIVSFVVFITIMNAILYKPVISIINERQSYIDGNNDAAQNSKKQAKGILEDKERQLASASVKSKEIIASKVQRENENSKNLTEKAKADATLSIDTAKAGLLDEETRTADALKDNVKELAESISSRILGENIPIDSVDYDLIGKVLK